MVCFARKERKRASGVPIGQKTSVRDDASSQGRPESKRRESGLAVASGSDVLVSKPPSDDQ